MTFAQISDWIRVSIGTIHPKWIHLDHRENLAQQRCFTLYGIYFGSIWQASPRLLTSIFWIYQIGSTQDTFPFGKLRPEHNVDILQTIFWNATSWTKPFAFCQILTESWNIWIDLVLSHHWFWKWLEKYKKNTKDNDVPTHACMHRQVSWN